MNKKQQTLAIVAVFLLAMNLRAPIVSLGAVSDLVSVELGLSSSMIGLLTTLPLLTFSVASVLVPALTKRFSLIEAIVIGIVLIAIGEGIRSFTSTIGLYAGTLFMGLGIGLENVLVLRYIKTHFQNRIGFMTGFFSSVMSLMSGIGAWLSLELMLRRAWGWRQTLSIWIPTILFALLVWIFQIRSTNPRQPDSAEQTPDVSLLVRPKHRHLIFYISMQSFVFYCVVAWLPSILHSLGVDGNRVGQWTFLLQLVSVPAGLFFPIIAQHLQKKTRLALLAGALLASGIMLLQWVSTVPFQVAGVILIGVGLGGSFSMGMAFINFLTSSPEEASSLAARSLSIGYLVAAAGPLWIGFIHDRTSSWTVSLAVILVAVLSMTYHGLQTSGNPVVE